MKIKAIIVDRTPESACSCPHRSLAKRVEPLWGAGDIIEFECPYLPGNRNSMTPEVFQTQRCMLCQLMTHEEYIQKVSPNFAP